MTTLINAVDLSTALILVAGVVIGVAAYKTVSLTPVVVCRAIAWVMNVARRVYVARDSCAWYVCKRDAGDQDTDCGAGYVPDRCAPVSVYVPNIFCLAVCNGQAILRLLLWRGRIVDLDIARPRRRVMPIVRLRLNRASEA